MTCQTVENRAKGSSINDFMQLEGRVNTYVLLRTNAEVKEEILGNRGEDHKILKITSAHL